MPIFSFTTFFKFLLNTSQLFWTERSIHSMEQYFNVACSTNEQAQNGMMMSLRELFGNNNRVIARTDLVTYQSLRHRIYVITFLQWNNHVVNISLLDRYVRHLLPAKNDKSNISNYCPFPFLKNTSFFLFKKSCSFCRFFRKIDELVILIPVEHIIWSNPVGLW